MKPKVFSMYLFLKPEIIHSLMTHNNNVEIFPLQQFSTHFFLPIQVHNSRNVSVFFLHILVFLLYWFTTINKLLFQNQFLLDLKFLLIPVIILYSKNLLKYFYRFCLQCLSNFPTWHYNSSVKVTLIAPMFLNPISNFSSNLNVELLEHSAAVLKQLLCFHCAVFSWFLSFIKANKLGIVWRLLCLINLIINQNPRSLLLLKHL